MTLLIALLACITTFLGLYLNSLGIVLLAAWALLIEVIILRSDLSLINQGLTALAKVESNKKQRNARPLMIATSVVASKAIDLIDGLAVRINALSWESDENNRSSLAFDKEVRVDDFSLEELFSEILAFVEKRFRCQAAGIIYRRNETAPMSILTQGISGQKINSRLAHLGELFFSSKNESFNGLRDGFEEESLFADFNPFGLRYSVTSSFQGNGALAAEGVLWLGYPEDRMPTKSEIQWAESLCSFISMQLNTKNKVKDLHQEIQSIQSDSKARTRFFADLSHDVRTPLNNLKNILALIRFEAASPESLEMLHSAMDSCDQVADLMEDILTYSQSKVGELKVSPRMIILSEMLPRLVSMFSASAELKGLKLEVLKIPAEAVITFDTKHFRRIISNIISNAIKYTERGRIEVSVVESAGQNWSILVRDTGHGLEPAELKNLFTPFSRFDRSGVEGVGLGLALSKMLAEANGCTIIPNSKLGQGSEFELRVPKEAVIGLAVRSESILLVDDDRDFLISTAKLIERSGLNVLTSTTVNEAVAIIQMSDLAAVISDGAIGSDDPKAIIEAATKKDISVIVLTGKSDTAFADKMKSLGAGSVLTKPVEIQELLAEIAALDRVSSLKIAASA